MGKILTPEEYLKKIAKEDKDTIFNLNQRRAIEFIHSGSWVINQMIGDGTMTGKPGGFPRGHITEIVGDESSGKTTLALSAIRQAQEAGGFGVLIDYEQTFHQAYAEKIGLSMDSSKLIVTQPNYFQQGARQIKDMFAMKPDIIVVDSVAAMTPKEVLEGDIDETTGIGLQARLMSIFLSYITKFLKNSNTALVFTNQLRSVIKAKYDTGPKEESSGGRALKFYASLRLMLKKKSVETINARSVITGKSEKEPVNVSVKASVIKSKIDKPYCSAPIYIRFGEGIDNISSVIDLALNTGVLKKGGSTYTFNKDGQQLVKTIGRDKMWRALKEDDNLFATLRSSLVFNQDEEIKGLYEKEEDELPDEMEDMMENVATTYIDKKKKNKEEKEEAEE